MTDETRMTPLAGSERTPLAGARSTGRLEPTTPVEVTVYLRPRADGDLAARDEPSGSIISRAELAERRGADPGELGAVEEYATGLGLEVVERDLAGRRLRLRGPASAMEAAFGVQLERFEHEHGSYRGHSGAVRLPGGLAGSVVAVLGLDDRPQAHTHFRPLTTQPAVSYTAVEVAAAYGAPASLSGKGVCVALIELGGGFTTADLAAYFTGLGLAVPTVEAVAVDGGSNSPTGDGSGPDAEVMLDIEVVGAVANGATVAVYFAPNTDQGFADALERSGPRHHPFARGHLGQLGRSRELVHRAGGHGLRAGLHRRRARRGDRSRRRGRLRVVRRGGRWPGPRRLSGLEPAGRRLRRHPAHAPGWRDRIRGRLERRRRRWRDGRRRERDLSPAELAGVGGCADIGEPRGRRRARRPRRRRRRRSRERLRRQGGRVGHGGRRDLRRRAALCGLRRACCRAGRTASRLHQPPLLCGAGERLSRHHVGQQRRGMLPGPAGTPVRASAVRSSPRSWTCSPLRLPAVRPAPSPDSPTGPSAIQGATCPASCRTGRVEVCGTSGDVARRAGLIVTVKWRGPPPSSAGAPTTAPGNWSREPIDTA